MPDSCDHAAEAALVAALRAGDRQAAEDLVRRHGGWMQALARRLVRDAALAEDCVQEAFLQAFRGIGAFEGRSALRSWLHRILVNAALMKLRSRPRPEAPLAEAATAATDWSTPERILEAREACALVAEKLQALPEAYRIVLLLRDIQGLSTEETARVLETTEGAVKVRLHRARAAFRTLVAPVLSQYV